MPGVKFPVVFVFVVNGNKFSNVGDAGNTVQGTGSPVCQWLSPANWALSGLTPPGRALTALQPSTMLNLALPMATSAGIVTRSTSPTVERRRSEEHTFELQ